MRALVDVGGLTFGLAGDADVVEACSVLGPLRPPAAGEAPAGPTFELVREGATAVRVVVVEPDGTTAPAASRLGAPVPSGGTFGSVSAAVHGAQSVMTERLVRAEPHWVHVHAGAVSVGGAGVLVPAASGTGKTTLTSELGALGAVLTDELVAVDRAAGVLRAPRRPLSVKASGFERFAARHPGAGAPPPAEQQLWHVPLDALGLRHVDSTPAAVVLVPSRRPGAVHFSLLDPAAVLLQLVDNAYDLDVDHQRAFADLAWLAAACHTVAVGYDDAADVAAALPGWLAAAGPRPDRQVVPDDDADLGVLAVRLGGGIVLWQPATRAVAWLDAAGADAWSARGQESPAVLRTLAGAGFTVPGR